MRYIKKIVICLLIAVLTLSSTGTYVAMAAGGSADNYVTADNFNRQPVPDCYIVSETIYNMGDFEDPNPNVKKKTSIFKGPRDLFIDDYDNIFVVDTGNNRIIKFDADHNAVAVFYGPEGAGEFKNPQGIFVDADGDMYLADTDNHRIVHMDSQGNLVEIFTNPESNLSTGEVFSPSKLIVNDTGYIYVVRGENIMAIDGSGTFRGYYGQTNIGFNLSDVLIRMFASDQQKLFATKRLASSYINIAYSKDGNIYATSLEREEGEIKKLNSVGTNFYRKYKTVGNSLQNPIKAWWNKALKSVVAGQSFRFGEYFDDNYYYMEPIFTDICVDDNGIVTVIEQLNGKVYQYDQSGRMLVAFGGLGEKKGTFSRSSSIEVDSKGRIYILDQINNNIQIFEPTEFIQNIHAATSTYNDGDYQASYDLWVKVLATDENYDLAHMGIARALYKQGRYKEAMKEAKLVGDRDTYTMAFDEYKYEVLRAHFFPIVLLAFVIIIAVIFLIKTFAKAAHKGYWSFLREKNKKMSIGAGIMYSFNVILHPFDAYAGLKHNRDRINPYVPMIILVIAYIVRVAYLYIVHFPLASIETKNINLWLELVKLWLIPLSWIPASFMATSISGGESKVKEITFASVSSLTPYIVITTPLMFLSNIMSKSQQSWYGVFEMLAYVGMFLLLFVAMMTLNNYTFGKTIAMMLMSAFLMAVMWLVMLLCYVLTGRMIQFVISLFEEFRLNFL
ncbi:MAG: SMP-30/gluconolactonase/LRE family protein [Lachnospiraceae bacterium]|nr:SMP-30/gluconolactonase/LRE family protein [Lachnospiraceae bacterium]